MMIVFLPTASFAHPHAWVDTSTYINSDQTHLTSMQMTWAFDAETSQYMLQGEDVSPDKIAQTLNALAQSVVANMYNEHYFTYLYDDKTPIRFKTARYPSMVQDQDKLVLSFEIPLSKPIAFKGKKIKLVIYDPTYFVDMSWIDKGQIQVSEQVQSQCTGILQESTVSDAQRAYTMTLASDVAPDTRLGEIFSQKYQLNCQ